MDLDMREKAVVDALRLVDGKERNREQNFLRIVSDYRARVAELEAALKQISLYPCDHWNDQQECPCCLATKALNPK